MSDLLNKNYIDNFHKINCDYLVVGSGAGGSVAAYELAKKNKDVILVEEGDHYSIDYFKGSVSNSFSKVWRNAGVTPIIGNPFFGFGEGKCLGGSTYINGGLLWRTPDYILDEWQTKLKTTIYNKNNMSPIFDKIEKNLSVKVEQEEDSSNNDSKLLLKIAQKNNIKSVLVPRAIKDCKRFNKCTTGCVSGAKQSTLQSYIYPAAEFGLRILTNSRAEKITLKDNLPNTLIIKRKNKYINVKFNKIILACGPIQTPLLLKKSFGHSCIKSKMQIHINLRLNILFDEKLNSEFGTIFTRQIQEYLNDGILFMPANFNQSYLFSSLNNLKNDKIAELKRNLNYMATYVLQIRSTNEVIISKFFNEPLLYYKLNDFDFLKIKKYLKLFSEMMFGVGAKKIYLPLKNNYSVKNTNEVENILFNTKKNELDLVSVHGMSSARMAAKKTASSFFNINGKSFNFDNLFCVDSSILPSNTTESPQGTIMAVAHSIIDREVV